jgi:hypothetical protein
LGCCSWLPVFNADRITAAGFVADKTVLPGELIIQD